MQYFQLKLAPNQSDPSGATGGDLPSASFRQQDPQLVAIEIAVRLGREDVLETLAKKANISGPRLEMFQAEAGLWSNIQQMREEAEGGVDAARFVEELSDQHIEYLLSASNPRMAASLIEVLSDGADGNIEVYAQVSSVEVLCLEPVATFLRRHIEQDATLRPKIGSLVETCYLRIFGCVNQHLSASEVKELMVHLNAWQDFIEPEKVVTDALKSLSDFVDEDEFASQVRLAMELFGTLVEASRLERLIHANCDAQTIAQLRALKLVPPTDPDTDRTTATVESALAALEKTRAFEDYDFAGFAKRTGAPRNRIAVAILSQRFGDWLSVGQLSLIRGALTFNGGELVDIDAARASVANVVRQALSDRDQATAAARLERLVQLPIQLLDRSDPVIAPFSELNSLMNGLKEVTTSPEVSVPALAKPPSANEGKVDGKSAATRGRKFVEITPAQLEKKVDPLLEDLQLLELAAVAKDLEKVSFDTENIEWRAGEGYGNAGELVGYHQLPNGLSFLGFTAGGDWEAPVFFLIYWDGKSLRGYIPEQGNPWNRKAKCAYGNEDSDLADFLNRDDGVCNLSDERRAELENDDVPELAEANPEKIREDITARFVRK